MLHLAESPTPNDFVGDLLRAVVPTRLFVCVVPSHSHETASALLPVKSASASGGAADGHSTSSAMKSVYTKKFAQHEAKPSASVYAPFGWVFVPGRMVVTLAGTTSAPTSQLPTFS